MLKLLIFPAAYGQPSVSPFCTKSAVLMRLSGVEHTVRPGDPRTSPTSKLPCLVHEGGVLPDSGLIAAWLKENHGVDLDADLTPTQRATAHVVRRTLEENLYWILVYSRWIDEGGWVHQLPVLKTMLPAAMSWILPGILRRGIRKSLHAQGLGRHDQATLYAAGVADIQAIEDLIEGPFMFGDKLTTADIGIFAFIGAVLANQAESPVERKARACPKVVALCEAVEARYNAAS